MLQAFLDLACRNSSFGLYFHVVFSSSVCVFWYVCLLLGPLSLDLRSIQMVQDNVIFFFFFPFIFISWRLITLQHCSGFCHTLTWISHGFTCVPHPDPPSYLLLHPIPLGLPSAIALSTCLMHPTWAGDLFHPWLYTCFNAVLSEHPNLAFSYRV